jgi:hypothetical protein
VSFPASVSDLDLDQLGILDKRLSDGGLGGIQGPPGTGKTLLMAHEAAIAYALGIRPIVVAAFGNQTVDNALRYTRALLEMGVMTKITGDPRDHLCRVGYSPAISDDIRAFHSNRPSEIKRHGLIFTTLHSTWRLARSVNAERIIIDETAQARPEQAYIVLENALAITNSRIDLTVVGDHMQARPISPGRNEMGILSRLSRSSPERMSMLRMTYREPEPIVDMTSQIFYDGQLDAPPEVRSRRLDVDVQGNGWIRAALDSSEPLTFADFRAPEVSLGYGFSNPGQAEIVQRLTRAYSEGGFDVGNENRFIVLCPYRNQVIETRRQLAAAGFSRVKVLTVTKALGLEAEVAIFEIGRSNGLGNLGMSGWPEILNVATSRMRSKLILLGNLETFSEGNVYESSTNRSYRSKSREIARFIERKGQVVTVQDR